MFGMIGIFLIMALSIVSLSAIGVGGPEFLEIYPGQSIERALSLQNLPEGNGDLIFTGIVEEGVEYVSFIDNDIKVKDGEIGSVKLSVSVPEDAIINEVYNIEFKFSTSADSSDEGGEGTAVQFNLGTGFSLNINVIEEPEEPAVAGSNLIWWVLGIVIILLIIIIFFFIKKKQSVSV